MEIKVQTGFFEIQRFDLLLGNENIALHSGKKLINIPYNKVNNLIISKEKNRSAKLEIVTDREVIDGVFTHEEDAEIFEKNFKNHIYKNIQINIKIDNDDI